MFLFHPKYFNNFSLVFTALITLKCFSLVLLTVADADYRFTYIDVGGYGSSIDSSIFRNSTMAKLVRVKKLNIPTDRPWPNTSDPSYPFLWGMKHMQ